MIMDHKLLDNNNNNMIIIIIIMSITIQLFRIIIKSITRGEINDIINISFCDRVL